MAKDLRICTRFSRGNAAFPAFPLQDGGFRRESLIHVRPFCTLQASTAYKYLVIRPKIKLDREQRAEHHVGLCYSNFSWTLTSLQLD